MKFVIPNPVGGSFEKNTEEKERFSLSIPLGLYGLFDGGRPVRSAQSGIGVDAGGRGRGCRCFDFDDVYRPGYSV